MTDVNSSISEGSGCLNRHEEGIAELCHVGCFTFGRDI